MTLPLFEQLFYETSKVDSKVANSARSWGLELKLNKTQNKSKKNDEKLQKHMKTNDLLGFKRFPGS